jgi:Holliday junction DNA helicase RuvA
VRCGSRTLSHLPALGDEALLHVETQWSEQQGIRLYGFLTRQERSAFVILLDIQGVGPKAALSILDVLTPGELAQAAARDDRASVSRANGVGPKLALRIVTELKGKPIADGAVAAFHAEAAAHHAPPPSAVGDAVAALMGLGYPEAAARRVVDQAALRHGEDASEAVLIKAALQELGR